MRSICHEMSKLIMNVLIRSQIQMTTTCLRKINILDIHQNEFLLFVRSLWSPIHCKYECDGTEPSLRNFITGVLYYITHLAYTLQIVSETFEFWIFAQYSCCRHRKRFNINIWFKLKKSVSSDVIESVRNTETYKAPTRYLTERTWTSSMTAMNMFPNCIHLR